MNELQIFRNEEFGEVRAVEIEGEAWFVGKDVAEILGYERVSKALQDHVDETDKKWLDKNTQALFRTEFENQGNGVLGQRGGCLINESGVYSLIFSSRLPKAKGFKRWVTSEVLPAIRKTGMYSTLAQRKAELAALMKEQDGKISKYAMGNLALMAAQLITGLPVPGTQQSGANRLERSEEVKDAVAQYMEAVYPSERRPVRVSCAALYERFKAWCKANGCEPCGRGLFFGQLTAQGFGGRRRLYRSPITGEVTRGYDLV